MKKYLIAIALMLALGLNTEAASQKHRHSKVLIEQVDSAQKPNDAIEAFSDTTTVAGDTVAAYAGGQQVSISADEDVKGVLDEVFGVSDKTAIAGMFFVAVIIFIMFVLAPILIITAVFYFINKNRKERIKLAQMAMEKGQPIPDELL
jgi:K+-transporting ATPase A subunit